jgi:uncharacterized cupredoxin-like copper-binding protein
MGVQRRLFVVVIAIALTGACGGGSDHMSHGGSSAAPTRTVDVTMKEFAYEPASVSVMAGETVKFVFHNEGKIVHDAFIGDEAAQAAHEKDMGEGMKHHGDDAIKIIPGATDSLTHTFKAGEALIIGCHETGHYQSGMKMTLTVS